MQYDPQGQRQDRHTRVHIHHQDTETLQTNQTLAGTQDIDTHVQGFSQGTYFARLLPRTGYCRLR